MSLVPGGCTWSWGVYLVPGGILSPRGGVVGGCGLGQSGVCSPGGGALPPNFFLHFLFFYFFSIFLNFFFHF